MAKFWEHLRYHEDNIEKHKITKEEIQFLKELQLEMNTQDNVGQADPRYWVIKDFKKVYGGSLEDFDGICIFDNEACGIVCEVEYQYMNVEGVIEEILGCIKEQGYELEEETTEKIKSSYDTASLMETLKDMEEVSFSVMQYKEIPVEKGFFFTQKAAEQHLRENQHHYDEIAHTYGHTAWRSSEEKLWDILQKVDFDALD